MYSQYPELLVRRGLLHRDATTSSVLCCAPSMLTCESKWHRSCAFGLKGSELGCQPAHAHHTALRLLSTASGCAQQIYGVQPSPGTQQKLMDSTFLKHLAAAATVLSPTTSTCWCQPQEPAPCTGCPGPVPSQDTWHHSPNRSCLTDNTTGKPRKAQAI